MILPLSYALDPLYDVSRLSYVWGMPAKPVVLNVRISQELSDAIDLSRGGEKRSAWVVRHLEGLVAGEAQELHEPATVHRLPRAPVMRGTVRRVAEADEIPLPAIAPRKPVEERSTLRAATGRPEKPARLAVARSVKTSAEIKAGLRPIDWRSGDDVA